MPKGKPPRKCPVCITQEEWSSVGIAGDDRSFVCLRCGPQSPPLGKRNATRHLLSHGLELEQLKSFVVCYDEHQIRNQGGRLLMLEHMMGTEPGVSLDPAAVPRPKYGAPDAGGACGGKGPMKRKRVRQSNTGSSERPTDLVPDIWGWESWAGISKWSCDSWWSTSSSSTSQWMANQGPSTWGTSDQFTWGSDDSAGCWWWCGTQEVQPKSRHGGAVPCTNAPGCSATLGDKVTLPSIAHSPSAEPTCLEVDVPTLKLSELAASYNPEGAHMQFVRKGKRIKARQRVDYPYRCEPQYDLHGFEEWYIEESLNEKVTKDETVKMLRRFFSLLEPTDPSTKVDPCGIEVVCAVYRGGWVRKLRKLPILDNKRAWSRKMCDALKQYLQYLEQTSKEKGMIQAGSICNDLSNTLAGWKKHSRRSKRVREKAKNKEDADLLDKSSPVWKVKNAVYESMKELQGLVAMYAGSDSMPPRMVGRATMLLVGIIFYNLWAGRPGEWQDMERAHVVSQLDIGLPYIVCQKHKTARFYGDLAKWVSPGTWHAFRSYLKLPTRKHNTKFLQPMHDWAKTISLDSYLNTWHKRFLSHDEALNPTQIRKMHHTVLAELTRSKKLNKLIGIVDPHGDAVIEGVYMCRNFKSDARLGESIFRGVFGDPVEWPPGEEVAPFSIDSSTDAYDDNEHESTPDMEAISANAAICHLHLLRGLPVSHPLENVHGDSEQYTLVDVQPACAFGAAFYGSYENAVLCLERSSTEEESECEATGGSHMHEGDAAASGPSCAEVGGDHFKDVSCEQNRRKPYVRLKPVQEEWLMLKQKEIMGVDGPPMKGSRLKATYRAGLMCNMLQPGNTLAACRDYIKRQCIAAMVPRDEKARLMEIKKKKQRTWAMKRSGIAGGHHGAQQISNDAPGGLSAPAVIPLPDLGDC